MQALKCKSTETFARSRKILGLRGTMTMAGALKRALRQLKKRQVFYLIAYSNFTIAWHLCVRWYRYLSAYYSFCRHLFFRVQKENMIRPSPHFAAQSGLSRG